MSGRKPHHAGLRTFASFTELLSAAAADQRGVIINGKRVVMTREEVFFRLKLKRAIEGSVRDLAFFINFLARQPDMAASWQTRQVIVLNGFLAKA